jgi:hypothetical protein
MREVGQKRKEVGGQKKKVWAAGWKKEKGREKEFEEVFFFLKLFFLNLFNFSNYKLFQNFQNIFKNL